MSSRAAPDPPLPAVDPELGLRPLFLSLRAADAIYFKVIVESYEGIGVVRSQDSDYAPGRVLLVLLLVPDMTRTALALLRELAESMDLAFPPATPAMLADLKRALLGELTD